MTILLPRNNLSPQKINRYFRGTAINLTRESDVLKLVNEVFQATILIARLKKTNHIFLQIVNDGRFGGFDNLSGSNFRENTTEIS